MSRTAVKLLRTASEWVGGDEALARHLGISQTLLAMYLEGSRVLPDRLLLRAVDIVLTDTPPEPAPGAASHPQESMRDG
jgi:hypothetical protein